MPGFEPRDPYSISQVSVAVPILRTLSTNEAPESQGVCHEILILFLINRLKYFKINFRRDIRS